jgi:ABC-type sulfate transport system permease subunit
MSTSVKDLTRRFGAASVASGHIRGQTNTLLRDRSYVTTVMTEEGEEVWRRHVHAGAR